MVWVSINEKCLASLGGYGGW